MMKFLSILAAASLALTPAIASAGSGTDSTEHTDNSPPISGPLAGRVLEKSAIPYGAIAVGGLFIFGGAILCLLECSGDGDATDSTTVTNGVPE